MIKLGDTEVTVNSFDVAIECMLIALLAFMPFTFGAVEAWSEEVVIALSATISIIFLAKLAIVKNARCIWSWSYIPVSLFIIITAFQLVSLPVGFVEFISTNTAAIKRELLGDLPNANKFLLSMTISFYPHATKHDLRLALSMAAIFVVVLNVYRQIHAIKRLLATIAIIGGGIAFLALTQDLFGNGKIYWFVPTYSQAYAGTFVNHSHYGQFMNLSMGAALGLIMVKIHEVFSGKKVSPPVVFEYLISPSAKVIWLLVLMIILGTATVFISLTRGGMVSMLIAVAFTTLVLISRKSLKGRGWIMALMALGAFICVLYMGFDAVYDRLATLGKLHEVQSGRWQIVKDIVVAWTKFPIFGTGLGTHEVIYPMFDRSTIPALAAYAENEYAQAAEETGLLSLVVLIVFVIIVWISYIRNVTVSYVPIRSAAYGLGFGLIAIMVHSLSDFGQHLPANAFLSALSCALLLTVARIGRETDTISNAAKGYQTSVSGYSRARRSVLCVSVLLCALAVWIWALVDANNARLAEASWERAIAAEHELSQKGWVGSNEEYIDLISHAASAANYQPDNVKYLHWLNVYRWRSFSRIADPNTGAVVIPEQGMQFVHRIVDELNKARLLCPTYGATYCVIGQLEKFILGDDSGAELIQKGFFLAPCDPTACFVAGLLDIEQQRIDASFEKFSKAVQLDGSLFGDVAGLYINHAARPDLAMTLAGDDTNRLSQVANILADTEEHKEIVEQTRQRVTDLLKARCQEPDAPAWALASLANTYKRENNNDKAIECYRRALTLDYGQVNWRFMLARLLADTGQVREAIHEARICLRLRPQFKAAEELIANLSVRPAAGDVGRSDERRVTRDE
jgi:tetratricopeptide (TPR) repeat protein